MKRLFGTVLAGSRAVERRRATPSWENAALVDVVIPPQAGNHGRGFFERRNPGESSSPRTVVIPAKAGIHGRRSHDVAHVCRRRPSPEKTGDGFFVSGRRHLRTCM